MKPGWIRLSLHPTMTDNELLYITDAIRQTAKNALEWKKDYCYDRHTNEFSHCSSLQMKNSDYSDWFKLV
jgi:hypothetical protein